MVENIKLDWNEFISEIKFWFRFLKDKRFNARFRIANLIMGDALREILMHDSEILEQIADSNLNLKVAQIFCQKEINGVLEDIDNIMLREE